MAVAKQSFYKRRRISSFVLDESLLWQFRRCLREHNDFEIWFRYLTVTFGILLLFKQELYFQCKKAISFLECLIQNTFKLQVFFFTWAVLFLRVGFCSAESSLQRFLRIEVHPNRKNHLRCSSSLIFEFAIGIRRTRFISDLTTRVPFCDRTR